MKPLNVILPAIHKKKQKVHFKTKRVLFNHLPTPTTFTNWKKNAVNKKTQSSYATTENLYNNISIQPNKSNKKLIQQSISGITLEEYFKTRNLLEINQNTYQTNEQDILPYIEHNFLIEETEENEDSEVETSIKTMSRIQIKRNPQEMSSLTKQMKTINTNSNRKLKTQNLQYNYIDTGRIINNSSTKKATKISKSRENSTLMQLSLQFKDIVDPQRLPLLHSIFKTRNKCPSASRRTKSNRSKQGKSCTLATQMTNMEMLMKYSTRLRPKVDNFREVFKYQKN